MHAVQGKLHSWEVKRGSDQGGEPGEVGANHEGPRDPGGEKAHSSNIQWVVVSLRGDPSEGGRALWGRRWLQRDSQ